MTIALVTSSALAGLTTGPTTAPIDTSTANLLVVAVTELGTGGTLSDNKSNTWTPLTEAAGFGSVRLFYCLHPTTVGSGHTVTFTGSYSEAQLLAFSGVAAFDQELHAAALSPGTCTPAGNNELIVIAVDDHGTGNDFPSAPSGFTLTAHISGDTSNNFATGIAYQIQTTGTAVTPTWTETGTGDSPGAVLAAFTATGGGGATTYTLTGPSSGATGSASTNFTVTAVGTLGSGVTITPHTTGTGTFTPTTVTLAAGTNTSATFTYTPSVSETKTISTTNSSTLTDPAGISYTSSTSTATSYTLTGPTPRMGVRGSASGNFTVTPVGGNYTGTITITPSGGGLSTPIVLTFSGSSAAQTFTITPTAKGVVTLTPTASPALGTDPLALSYVSLAKVKIVFKGDSLTYGTNASSGGGTTTGTTYPGVVMTELQGSNSFFTSVNLGTVGEELSAMLAAEAGEIAPAFDATKDTNILVIMAGTNDLLHFNTTAAAIWANMVTYVANAQGYGFKVIIQMVPPATYSGGSISNFNPIRDQLNDLIRSNWRSTQASAISDIAADSRIGWDGDEFNGTYYAGDFLHMTDAGYAIVAQYATQAIQSVLDGATNGSGTVGGMSRARGQ